MLPAINNKHKSVIMIFIILLLVFAGYNNYIREKKTVYILSESKEGNESNDIGNKEEIRTIKPINKEVIVHIEGEVVNSGIYRLSEEARVIDAVEAAGGLKDTADRKKVNLAKRVIDEEFIYIPSVDEEEFPSFQMNSASVGNIKSSHLLNINKASKNELEGLPGIGATLADRIIEYRNHNGGFNSIEDIRNVSGIGEKKYTDIKDLITVK